MPDIDTFLQSEGYAKPKIAVTGLTSIKDFIPKTKRCGIYVLHFANDEYYIGLSINVATRFLQHRKTYDDIEFVSFKRLSLGELRKEEERIIKNAEKSKFRLRNKIHTSVTVSTSPFDEIMDIQVGTEWIADVDNNDFSGERIVDEEHRRKYQRNYQHLREKPMGNEAIEVFRQYVKNCIPAPLRTELYYWSVTCLPGDGKWLYIRLNVKQEVLRIVKSGNDIEVVFFLARSVYENNNFFKNLGQSLKQFLKYRAITGGIGLYEAGGQDQIAVSIFGYENALKLLNEEKFIRAVRTLNLRIMRKTFNLQYRYHCYDLADQALTILEQK